MHIKTAGAEMKNLLEASRAEQAENIKRARWNAHCTTPDLLKPYANEAFCSLIRGVDELIGLAGSQGDE